MARLACVCLCAFLIGLSSLKICAAVSPTNVPFANGISFPANPTPVNVTIADVDGDGRPDIGVASINGGVSVLRNLSSTGMVNFAAPLFFGVGAPIDVKFGDLDGDGRPEMVAAVAGGVTVFQNLSTPGVIAFAPSRSFVYLTPSLPNGVVIEDLDGDGRLDLAFVHNDGSRVFVLQNVSTPGMVSLVLAAEYGFSRPFDLAGGDFNGDGKVDLLPAATFTRTFINNSIPGSFSFQSAGVTPSLPFRQDAGVDDALTGDIDDDGRVDLLCRFGNAVTLCRNTTTGGVSFALAELPGSWTGTGLGDLTGDDRLDVVTCSRFGRELAVFVNVGSPGILNSNSFVVGASINTSTNPFAIAIGDIDGDMVNDVVTCSTDGANVVTVYRNLSNHRPVADAGVDQVIECAGEITTVILDGSRSSDVDGDALSFSWQEGTTLVGVNSQQVVMLPPGAHTLTLEVTDAFAASSRDTVVVTIQDTTPPFIICASNLNFESGTSWTFTPPNAMDFCDGTNVAIRITSTVTNPVLSCEFSATRTWEVIDASGNRSSCSQTITVADTMPPTFDCSTNVIADATDLEGTAISFSAVAADNCDPFVLVQCVPVSGSTFPIGTNLVMCVATDSSSNSVQCSFTVTVLGPRGIKESVLAEMLSLQEQPRQNGDARLTQAISHLTRSLEPERWLNQGELVRQGGHQVFHEERLAVIALHPLRNNPRTQIADAVLEDFAARLNKADRLLAMFAIKAATHAGIDLKNVDRALSQITKGDAQASRQHYARSIAHYRDAWSRATRLPDY